MTVTGLTALLQEGTPVEGQGPFSNRKASAEVWQRGGAQIGQGQLTLVALWGDPECVYMALYEELTGTFGMLSCDTREGRFPSVARAFPPAERLERALRDLYGLEPEGARDTRPWLDHGRWGLRAPLGAGRAAMDAAPPAYRFLPSEGERLHQIPVGPVHAGIIEPGHFRFTASGEAVVRLEARLGYTHKGIAGLLAGAEPAQGARLAGRVSGDSTVAYALAFARALEAAAGILPSPRAVWLRGLMAELERLANHIGDIGAICNDAAFTIMHANCSMLREQILRASQACFGHRLMMDCVIPGGVVTDLTVQGDQQLREMLAGVRERFAELVHVYDNSPSMLQRSVGTGILRPHVASLFGCGGYVGRASLRDFDARRTPGYPPYDVLEFEVPVLNSGDVNARVWIRIKEVEQSLGLVQQILERLPPGAVRAEGAAATTSGAREGTALVEGFRGDIFAWLRMGADGRIEHCHLRDPSWFQWPALEAAIEGNIVADFPLCNKSFNCSYSGHDL